MASPRTSQLPPDVWERIDRDFSDEEDRAHVGRTLATLRLSLSYPSNKRRVARCILFVANGNRKAFDRMVGIARRDWCEAVLNGEYDLAEGKLTRARNFTEPFPPAAEE